MTLVDRMGWSVLGSGLFLGLAAIVSDRTGTHVAVGAATDPHVINTHTPATLVLTFLAVVLVVNGFVLLSYEAGSEGDEPGDAPAG
jgi:F0F1-type ATP synthase membrane subunit c/vacuolar-type H+-ATPase subunit K